MTALKTGLLAAGVGLAISTAAGGASAETLIEGNEFLPKEYSDRIMAGENGLEKMSDAEQARGLFSKFVVWPPSYAKLRVCFMAGSDATNAAVAKVASGWNDVANLSLKLDFGNLEKPRRCDPKGRESQIRVSYDKPGYWSLLGQYSMVYAAQNEASLNLEGFDQIPNPRMLYTGDLKGTILHEFGHAFGLMHEHQSPKAPCSNEFNWAFIFKYLSGPPNNWNEDTIKFNLQQYSGDDLMMTDFDAASIMLYSFPAEYYQKGKESTCYVGRSNTDISGSDTVTVEYMYSADMAARTKNFGQARAQLAELLKQAESSGTKAVGMDYMDAFFGAKGVAADEE
ncbi:MAG: hypothetical protein KDK89_04730 [Alphaproteobacteria bacterium]|nr:hypothetical protein [Alphaproteobacteria bacterium]